MNLKILIMILFIPFISTSCFFDKEELQDDKVSETTKIVKEQNLDPSEREKILAEAELVCNNRIEELEVNLEEMLNSVQNETNDLCEERVKNSQEEIDNIFSKQLEDFERENDLSMEKEIQKIRDEADEVLKREVEKARNEERALCNK